jgi:hypothetical protein
VALTLKVSFSLATTVQSVPVVDPAGAGAGAVTAAGVPSAAFAESLLPPQPANKTATEQKSK